MLGPLLFFFTGALVFLRSSSLLPDPSSAGSASMARLPTLTHSLPVWALPISPQPLSARILPSIPPVNRVI